MKTNPLFLAIALFGVLAVGCEDEPQVTDMCDTVTGMDVPTVKSIWATSVPDYSVKFTVLDSNWVHCDVHNESEYMLFFSDNCSYKYKKCDGDVNTVMITYQKDSTGIVTNCGGNNIYLIKKYHQIVWL